jgi:purine-binding chemotaxis protein CheW
VLVVPQQAFEPPPESLEGSARALIRGAYKLKDRLLLLLDIDQVVSFSVIHTSHP